MITTLTPSLVGSPSSDEAGVRSLVDAFIAENRALAAVDRFSRWHDRDIKVAPPAARYRDLLPLTTPATGQQFAFEVDLDACSGCKACVTACHSLNGLEEHEAWRSVGMLVDRSLPRTGGACQDQPSAAPQHITTACHHCVDPACLNGCPVLAYEKDAVTGIVRHLDDQCIGCSYCTMMCPYEVPRYSERLGIVRKCDMCHGRLAVGEAPACAQACPNEAIRVAIVDLEAVRANYLAETEEARVLEFLPDTPDPGITIPTTRYVSARTPLNRPLKSASDGTASVSSGHPPLVVMLVMTQLAAGAFLAAPVLDAIGRPAGPRLVLPALLIAAIGLAASVAHLGQPLKAWRSFLGWRRSWLSREILALNAFFGAAASSCLLLFLRPAIVSPALTRGVGIAAAILGVLGVVTSAMVYIATRRRFWSASSTLPRFLATVGIGAASACALATNAPAVWCLLATLVGIKVRVETAVLSMTHAQSLRSASLQCVALRSWLFARLVFGGLGAFSAAATAVGAPPALGIVAIMLVVAGEFIERFLFFKGIAPDRMPGLP